MEGQAFAESLLITAMCAMEHACPEAETTENYCHVDPYVLDVRDDSNPIWQAYKKFYRCYHYHLKTTEEDQR